VRNPIDVLWSFIHRRWPGWIDGTVERIIGVYELMENYPFVCVEDRKSMIATFGLNKNVGWHDPKYNTHTAGRTRKVTWSDVPQEFRDWAKRFGYEVTK
jgi:hypothetical protein